MDLLNQIKTAKKANDFDALINLVPYSRLLGMKSVSMGKELFFVLPASPDNIGNPIIPAIHGGAMGGFMESAALLHVLGQLELERLPKTIDFSLDYLRAGRDRDTYAICDIVRKGRQVVNVSITAWQEHRHEPVAQARAHLLL